MTGDPATTPEPTFERDVQADAAYARLFDAEIVRTVCAGPAVNFDVDWTGRPVGIEVLGTADWTAALVALFLRGEVRLVHGFDDDNPLPAVAAGGRDPAGRLLTGKPGQGRRDGATVDLAEYADNPEYAAMIDARRGPEENPDA